MGSHHRYIREFITTFLQQMIDYGSPALLQQRPPEDDPAPRIAGLERHIETLESSIRQMIRKQAGIEGDLYNLYDDEIRAAGERLQVARRNLDELRRQLPLPEETAAQERTFEEIVNLTLERFWDLSRTEINQYLHRLMNGARFVVRNGELTGFRPRT